MRHNSHRIHFQTKQISFGQRDESELTSVGNSFVLTRNIRSAWIPPAKFHRTTVNGILLLVETTDSVAETSHLKILKVWSHSSKCINAHLTAFIYRHLFFINNQWACSVDNFVDYNGNIYLISLYCHLPFTSKQTRIKSINNLITNNALVFTDMSCSFLSQA